MALPRSFQREIATVKNDLTYPLYGGHFSVGSRLQWKDKTLIQKGSAESYDIYQDLKRDPHVYAVLQKRYMAVVGREWRVEPGGERRADRKAADLVRAQLESLSVRTSENDKQAIVSGAGGFDHVCLGLLDAILIGFSVGEIIWDRTDTEIFPREIRIKNQRRFAFFADENGDSFLIKLLTTQNPFNGELLPARKFITHIFHGEYDNPYGFGLGGKLYWPAFFKKHNVKFWLAFNDKFGSPTAVGTFQPGQDKQREALLKAIKAIAQEAGVVIPEGTSLDFLEANRSSSINSYKDLASYMDEEISKAVLGETGTTDQSGSGGSRARDEVAERIGVKLAKFDADLLSDTLNRTLIKWIVDYNFAPGSVAYPTVWRHFPELEKEEDLNSRVNRDKTLQELGWRMTPEKQQEVYGEGYISITGQDEDEQPPLVSTLGVGGVQALTGFLSQVSQGVLPRPNAIATLTAIFGIPAETAEQMIPEQDAVEPSPGIQNELDSIFDGDDGTDINAESTAEELFQEQFVDASEGSCPTPESKAKDGSRCGGRATSNNGQFSSRAKNVSRAFEAINRKKKARLEALDNPELEQRIELRVIPEMPKAIQEYGSQVDALRDEILSETDTKKSLDWIDSNRIEDAIDDISLKVAQDMLYSPAIEGEDLVKDGNPEDNYENSERYVKEIIDEWFLGTVQKLRNDAIEKILSDAEDHYVSLIDDDIEMAEDESDRPRDIAVKYAEESVEEVQGIIDDWLSQIESVIEDVDQLDLSDSEKFETLQERLTDLYDEIPIDEYGDILGEALAAAEVAGRYEVVEGFSGDEIEFDEWLVEFAQTTPKTRNCKKGYSCGRSCISKTKKCHKKHSKQSQESQKWLTQNAQPSGLQQGKVELFKEHIISADKDINAATLDAAWDAIQTEGADERVALVRNIINEQRIQAVFNDVSFNTANKTDRLFDALENKEVAELRINEAINAMRAEGKSESSIKRRITMLKQEYVGMLNNHRATGYTRNSGRHVTILTDSIQRKGGFKVDPLTNMEGINNVFDRAEDGSNKPFTTTPLFSPESEILHTYIHEIGHQMHFTAIANGMQPSPSNGAKRLTRYSETDDYEYFAEHFVLWMMDAERFKQVDPMGYDFIDTTIKNLKGKDRRLL